MRPRPEVGGASSRPAKGRWILAAASRKLPGMNVVFLGSGAFAIPSLDHLTRSAQRVVHIISQPDRPAGRGKHPTPTPVAQWALDRGLPLTRTDNANGMPAMLRDLRADCLVVIAFGQKLSDELLGSAPHGGINLHASLLPKYRGAAPINWAIINNDALAGVSVIELTNVMDGGAILGCVSTPVGPAETAGELHDRLAGLGAPLVLQALDGLAAGTAARTVQDPGQATRAPKLSRDMAWIDFTQPSTIVAARIRGMSPWPGIQVQFFGPAADGGKARALATLLQCQATPSTAVHAPEQCGQVLPDRTIACGAGSLRLLRLQPAGKKPMDAQAFANGYGMVAGTTFRSAITPPAHS